jgi:hypothetical protein
MKRTIDADSCTPGLVVRVHDEYTGVVDRLSALGCVMLRLRGARSDRPAFIDSLTVVPENEVPDWAREIQAQIRARHP